MLDSGWNVRRCVGGTRAKVEFENTNASGKSKKLRPSEAAEKA